MFIFYIMQKSALARTLLHTTHYILHKTSILRIVASNTSIDTDHAYAFSRSLFSNFPTSIELQSFFRCNEGAQGKRVYEKRGHKSSKVTQVLP